MGLTNPELGTVSIVARSKRVYIEWLWKHCLLLSSYLRNEQILIDIRKYDRQIVPRIPFLSAAPQVGKLCVATGEDITRSPGVD
jgi:hypothetical protein